MKMRGKKKRLLKLQLKTFKLHFPQSDKDIYLQGASEDPHKIILIPPYVKSCCTVKAKFINDNTKPI